MKKKSKIKKNPVIDVHPKISDKYNSNSEFTVESKIADALYKKASNNFVDFEVILEVYNRGVNSWKENSKNLTKEQVGFARVNSFLAGGKAAQLDSELYETYTAKRNVLEKYYNIVVKSGQFQNKNVVTVDASTESDAYKQAHKMFKKSGHVRTNKVMNSAKKNYDMRREYMIKMNEGTASSSKKAHAKAFAQNFASALTSKNLLPTHAAHVQKDIHPEKPKKEVPVSHTDKFGNYSKDQKTQYGRPKSSYVANRQAIHKISKLSAQSPDEVSGASPRVSRVNFSTKNQKGTFAHKTHPDEKKSARKIGSLNAPSSDEHSGTAARATPLNIGKKDQKGYGNTASKQAKKGDAAAGRRLGNLGRPSISAAKAPESKAPEAKAPKKKVSTLGQQKAAKASGAKAPDAKAPVSNVSGKATATSTKPVAGKASAAAAKAPESKAPEKSSTFGNHTPSFINNTSKKPKATAKTKAPKVVKEMYITEKQETVPASHKEFSKHLKNMGFKNNGGTKHDEFVHEKSGVKIQVPRHGVIASGTAKTMWKQAKAAHAGLKEERDVSVLLSTFRKISKE